jgi:hypothetical protein
MNILGDNVSNVFDDGNPFKVSTTTPMIRVNVRVPEPRNVDERLDSQWGEVQHQVHLPQSFVLVDTISHPMGASTFGIVLVMMRKTIGSLFGAKTPSSMLGVAKMVC